MQANFNSRVIRKLVAADGYMDLDMPEHALRELDSINNAGPLDPPRQYLIGRALKSMGRFEEAVKPLESAAREMPAPIRKIAWRALSECYRECGNTALANVAEQIAGPAIRKVNIQFPGMDVSVSLNSEMQEENAG